MIEFGMNCLGMIYILIILAFNQHIHYSNTKQSCVATFGLAQTDVDN